MKKLAALTALTLMALSAPVWSAPKTVTLSLAGMHCATCPITVRKALSKVDGVEGIDVDLAKRQAVVRLDDARTNVAALTEATRNAGYPSTPVGQGK